MATDAGEDPARVVDSIFARKIPQGLARPPRNVLMIYKLFLDFALLGFILECSPGFWLIQLEGI